MLRASTKPRLLKSALRFAVVCLAWFSVGGDLSWVGFDLVML